MLAAANAAARKKTTNFTRACTSGKSDLFFFQEFFQEAGNKPLPCYNWWGKLLAMRKRITVSALVGAASGIFCWFLMKRFHQDAADFRWALHLAQRLLARQNPYDTPFEQYPVTAAFFALPFVRLPPETTAGLF